MAERQKFGYEQTLVSFLKLASLKTLILTKDETKSM